MTSYRESFFVGRAAELSTLGFALERARQGESRVAIVAGEPGVGKSRLAWQFAAGQAPDQVVCAARCWQWGGAPALWPWLQLLRELCKTEAARPGGGLADQAEALLAKMADGDTSEEGGGEQSRFALFDAIIDLLARVASQRPLLLLIDDIHAADPSSIDLLRFFGRDTRRAPILLVATMRDVEADASAEVDELLRDVLRDATLLKLRGLADAELEQMLQHITELPTDPEVVRALQRATGGNPLFVDGLVRAAVAQGGLQQLRSGEFPIPLGVREAIEQRLRRFDEEQRWVLGVVATIGRDCAPELVASASQLDMERVAAAFRAAQDEGVLVETPPASGRYAFSHALIAEAIYRDFDAAQRMHLHRAVGEKLERMAQGELNPHAAELARHFLSAGPGEPRQRGLRFVMLAADQSRNVFAYDEAAELYERALEVMALDGGAEPRTKGRVLLSLAEALLLSGRPESARAPLRRLLQLDPSDELFAESALMMARTAEFAVVFHEAVELLEQARQRLSERVDRLHVRVLSRLATSLWTDQRALERRRELTAAAVRMAEDLGDSRALAVALAARMSALSDPDHLEDRLQGVERLLSAANASGDLSLVLEAQRWRLTAYWETGDKLAADACLDEYQRLAERLNWPQARMNAALRRAVQGEMAGDLEQMERELRQLEQLGRLARDPQVDMYVAVGQVTLLRDRGQPQRIEEYLPFARAGCHRWRSLPAPAGALIEILIAAGRREEARAIYEELAVDKFRSLPRGYGTVAAYAMLAEACVAFDDRERAPTLRALLEPYAEHNTAAGLSTCKGSAARYLGRLALMMGDYDPAYGYFEKALRANRRMGARGYLAHTMRDYGLALSERGRPGDRTRAEALLREARTIAEELGIVPLVEELSGRAAGSQVGSKVPDILSVEENCLYLEGDVWVLRFSGRLVRLKDSRGLRYIHRLISHADRELHALELCAASSAQEFAFLDADSGPAIDGLAAAAYRSRVGALREEIEEARDFNDTARVERLQTELDAIAVQLSEGLGLGGRARRGVSAAERARVAVSRAIKRALAKIESTHPSAGEHLVRFVKTGIYCRYDPSPEARVRWVLSH